MQNTVSAITRKPSPELLGVVGSAVAIATLMMVIAGWQRGDIQALAARFDGVQESLAGIRERLTGVETRIGALELRIGAVESQMSRLDKSMSIFDERLSVVEGHVCAED